MLHPGISFLSRTTWIIGQMAAGIWVLVVIPAIIAFVFGVWVLYSIMLDVSEREDSPFTVTGPDRIRIRIDPPQ